MMKVFLGNTNIKRLSMAIAAVFVFIFATDFLIHSVLMKDMYASNASLWRTEAEMQSHFGWMLLGQFLIAKFFCVIFARGYENKGIWEGARFGVLMAPMSMGGFLINYAV